MFLNRYLNSFTPLDTAIFDSPLSSQETEAWHETLAETMSSNDEDYGHEFPRGKKRRIARACDVCRRRKSASLLSFRVS